MIGRDERGRFALVEYVAVAAADVIDEVCAAVADAPRPAPPAPQHRRLRRVTRQRTNRLVCELSAPGNPKPAVLTPDEEAA